MPSWTISHNGDISLNLPTWFSNKSKRKSTSASEVNLPRPNRGDALGAFVAPATVGLTLGNELGAFVAPTTVADALGGVVAPVIAGLALREAVGDALGAFVAPATAALTL